MSAATASGPGSLRTRKSSPSSQVSAPSRASSTMTSLKSSQPAADVASTAPKTAKASNLTAAVHRSPSDHAMVAALFSGRQYPSSGQFPATTSRWPTRRLASARNTTVASTASGFSRGSTSSKETRASRADVDPSCARRVATARSSPPSFVFVRA